MIVGWDLNEYCTNLESLTRSLVIAACGFSNPRAVEPPRKVLLETLMNLTTQHLQAVGQSQSLTISF
jgi:hypothetical protein